MKIFPCHGNSELKPLRKQHHADRRAALQVPSVALTVLPLPQGTALVQVLLVAAAVEVLQLRGTGIVPR